MSGGVNAAKSYRTANIRVTSVNSTEQDGLVTYMFSDVCSVLKEWASSAGITYWTIEHKADDDVSKTHFHMVIKFKSPVHFETIKNRFPYGDIESSRNLRASIQYLIHLNDKSKVQYSWDDIETNCLDMSPYKILSSSQQEITLQAVYAAVSEGVIREYNLFDKVPIELYAKHRTKIDNALMFYREKICMEKDRDIRVIFMSGSTGIGKTTFAKRYCESINADYCISSSSNDPLQDYKGEPVLIMDDLRDDSFKYHDFLKLLDNHTKSTIKSRYHNKAFIGDLIIITSTRPINDWYFNKTPEDKHQLYRRVRTWFKFDGNKIFYFEYDDKTKRYELVGSSPNPIVIKKEKTKQLIDVFSSMGVEFTPASLSPIPGFVDASVSELTDEETKKIEEGESRRRYDGKR